MFVVRLADSNAVLVTRGVGRADIIPNWTLHRKILQPLEGFGRLKIVSLNNIESLFCEDWGCYHGLLTTKAKQIWLAFLPAPNVYFASLAMDCGYRLMFNTISCLNSLYLPNVDEKRKEYSLKHETLPLILFSPPENEAISFCYGLCDVTVIQLKMSINSNLPHVIG